MHRSVLMNSKYIEFTEDNTVEFMALQRLDEGIEKNDPKAATYDATDKDGKAVKYLIEFPGMTVEDINNCSRSKGGQYNKTGKIPYTCVVDPHTEKMMQAWSGGQGAKPIMEAIEFHLKNLAKKYGPSLKRSDLKKFEEAAAKVTATFAKKGPAKAYPAAVTLGKKWVKKSPALGKKAEELQEQILAAASDQLDEAEGQITAGDLAAAKKILSPLAKVLKKTRLGTRAADLLKQTKPPKAE
jgi:hypothetical protein